MLEYMAAANAIPIEVPIDLLVAKKPEAILKEFRGTNPMIALLLAGRKIESPAPPIVIIVMNSQIGEPFPSFVSITSPTSNVK